MPGGPVSERPTGDIHARFPKHLNGQLIVRQAEAFHDGREIRGGYGVFLLLHHADMVNQDGSRRQGKVSEKEFRKRLAPPIRLWEDWPMTNRTDDRKRG